MRQLLIRIDNELHERFKLSARLENMTLSEWIRAACNERIKFGAGQQFIPGSTVHAAQRQRGDHSAVRSGALARAVERAALGACTGPRACVEGSEALTWALKKRGSIAGFVWSRRSLAGI
jgi:hypothetical protein